MQTCKTVISVLGMVAGLAMFAGGVAADEAPVSDAAAPEAPAATVYTNVSLIDGTGAPLKEAMSILVEGTKITAVLPAADMDDSLPENVTVVDGSDWYALPGLIDTHVHLATDPNPDEAEPLLRRYLYSGLTSVRDMAGDVRYLAYLARQTRLNEMDGPDVYYASLMAGPSFFKDPRPAASAQGGTPGEVPWMLAVTPETPMVQAVAQAKGTWATGIKIYANLDAAEVRRITEEGHAQGMKVWAHTMVFPALPGEVIAAGVDTISHVCRLVYEAAPERPTEYHHSVLPDYASIDPGAPQIRAAYNVMKAQGTILDATLWLYSEQERKRRENPEGRLLPGACPSTFAAGLVRVAHEMGVEISTGTDGQTPIDQSHPALFDELETLANDAGIAPLQVIRSATYVGAMTMGLEKETGTVEAGKAADLMFVTKNPLDDIANLRSVVLTVKNGKPYPRADFVPGGTTH